MPHWDDRPATGGGDPLHWGIFYSEWVVNALARFIADAHHRGVLWRLPMRVVENLPLVGLDFLVEGSAYQQPVVDQLLRLQADCDWDSWARRGYGSVAAVPIHMVGSEYRIQELVSLRNIPRIGTSVGPREEEPEEVIAPGRVRSPQLAVGEGVTVLPREPADSPVRILGRDGLEPVIPRMDTPGSPVLVPDEGNPGEGDPSLSRRGSLAVGPTYPTPGTGLYGMSPTLQLMGRPPYLGRLPQEEPLRTESRVGVERASGIESSAGDRRVPIGGERSGRRNLFGSLLDVASSEATAYEHPEARRTTYNSLSMLRGDLEQYLNQEGILGEVREVANSCEWTVETVGTAFRRLLDSRRNHRWHAEQQRQRIAALEAELTARTAHDRETAIRVNRVVGELAAITVRCHEGPAMGRLQPGPGEECKNVEQEGGRKRVRTDNLGEWGPGLPPT
jgi:hypothetical protein